VVVSGAVLAGMLAACDPAVGPDIASQFPKPGLTMIVEKYNTDMYGTRDTFPPEIHYITVSSNTSAYAGRSPVTRLIDRLDTGRLSPGDTTYISYGENGDIGILEDFDHLGLLSGPKYRWMGFPLGSKATSTFVVHDTAFTRSQKDYTYRESWTARFAGSERIDTGLVRLKVPRGDLATVKAQVVQSIDSAAGFPLLTPVETSHTIWYSPKYGTIVRWEIVRSEQARPNVRVGAGVGFRAIGFMQR
jgi:hypothetical protein